MKRIALLAVIGAGLLALPSSAAATSDCSYAGGGPAAPAVVVYGSDVPAPVGNGTGGRTGDADAGVCANAAGFGGYFETSSDSEGTYAVVDGSDNNPANSAGYAGVNNRNEANPDPVCDGVDADNTDNNGTPPGGNASGDENTGGCFWFRAPLPVVGDQTGNVPLSEMFVCGNTSGPDWQGSTRDGCSVP